MSYHPAAVQLSRMVVGKVDEVRRVINAANARDFKKVKKLIGVQDGAPLGPTGLLPHLQAYVEGVRSQVIAAAHAAHAVQSRHLARTAASSRTLGDAASDAALAAQQADASSKAAVTAIAATDPQSAKAIIDVASQNGGGDIVKMGALGIGAFIALSALSGRRRPKRAEQLGDFGIVSMPVLIGALAVGGIALFSSGPQLPPPPPSSAPAPTTAGGIAATVNSIVNSVDDIMKTGNSVADAAGKAADAVTKIAGVGSAGAGAGSAAAVAATAAEADAAASGAAMDAGLVGAETPLSSAVSSAASGAATTAETSAGVAAAGAVVAVASVAAIAASLIAPNLDSTKAAQARQQFWADHIYSADIVTAKNPIDGSTMYAGGFRGTMSDDENFTTITSVGPQTHLNQEGADSTHLWQGQYSIATKPRVPPPPPPPPLPSSTVTVVRRGVSSGINGLYDLGAFDLDDLMGEEELAVLRS